MNSSSLSSCGPCWLGCRQRPGLLLLNGVVYIGFAAHVDTNPWHGWVLAYNATTLQQTGFFCATPNDNGGGIRVRPAVCIPTIQLEPHNTYHQFTL